MSIVGAELWELVAEDAGNPRFADLAELLRSEGKLTEAIDVCLAGLSANPVCHKGRLVLSRLFLQKGYTPFALREIELLSQSLPDNTAIQKLALKLNIRVSEKPAQASAGSGLDALVAEAELDFDDIDLIEKE